MDTVRRIGIKEFIKRYGWKYGVKRAIFVSTPIHFVGDKLYRKILYYKKVQNIVRMKYLQWSDISPQGLVFHKDKVGEVVWVYWDSGLEHAPDIVKVCVDSIVRNSEQEVIILTDENLSEYIEFPKYIVEDVCRGRISRAHFSDLLRLSLLEHYGGTWIDATVYLTDKLPEYIVKSNLFLYRDSCGFVFNPALMANWMIHSTSNNTVIRESRNILFEYWRTNDKVIEYLLAYIVFFSVLQKHLGEFDSIPYASTEYSYLLLKKMNSIYNVEEYEHIKEMTSVHKLSHKMDFSVLESENTYYFNLIVKGEK